MSTEARRSMWRLQGQVSVSRSWILSLCLHLAIGGLFLVVFWLNGATPEKKIVDISVLEIPRLAPRPVEITRPRDPKKKILKQHQVFGLSRKAMTGLSPEGIQVKQGNTILKPPDNEKLKDTDADSLPIPSEEYLVTRMPEISAEIRIPYPAEAKKKKIQGAVVMDILIDAEGRVRDVKLLEGPSSELDDAAVTAVLSFSFKPALIQEKPVAVRIHYAYRFILEK